MPDMNKKLDRFTATILAEATAETERAMQQARAQRDVALRTAEDQVLLEAYQYIHGEVARIKGDSGRRVSQRLLDNKRTLYLRREEIAQEVLGLVRRKIAAFTATDAYGDRLETLLHDALARLAGAQDVTLLLRPQDEKHAPRLSALLPTGSRVGTGEFLLGGLIVQSQTLGLRVDACFDSAAEALSGRFAALFGLSLADDEHSEGGDGQ